jgi:hypothetical protein
MNILPTPQPKYFIVSAWISFLSYGQNAVSRYIPIKFMKYRCCRAESAAADFQENGAFMNKKNLYTHEHPSASSGQAQGRL